MLDKLVLATQNQGKIKDFKIIFDEFKFPAQIILPENIEEPAEDGNSFIENASIKAKFYGKHYNLPAIADDSGLMIECLGGFPGIRTREFADEHGGYRQSFAKLEEMLKSHKEPFSAKFISAIVFYDPSNDRTIEIQESLNGRIDFSAKDQDKNGFGYTPIFIADGYTKTLSQISNEERNKISHRRKAMEKLLAEL